MRLSRDTTELRLTPNPRLSEGEEVERGAHYKDKGKHTHQLPGKAELRIR